MLMLLLTSKFPQLMERVEALALGSLARVTVLAADADMCLLMRLEVPRGAIRMPAAGSN
jgi:hypothetical protein